MDKQVISERHWVEGEVKRGWRTAGPFFKLARGLGYIGGSFAAWMSNNLCSQPVPNDMDIFAISENAATLISQRIYNQWDCAIIDNGFVHSITFTAKRLPVQVVRPHPDWHKFPDDILHSFDLDVCRALLVEHNKLLLDENVGHKSAKILRMADPVRTLKRVIKYAQRGITFNEWELLKLFKAWEEITEQRRSEITTRAVNTAFPQTLSDLDYDYVDDDDYWDGE